MKVELTRGIFIAGEPKAIGEQVDVPDNFARELITTNKATAAPAAPTASGALNTDGAAALVRGKKTEA